jgi:excinuclease UvrABC ATPase subunit
VIYIFDEPSIGLHPRDVHRLNELLQKLRDKGNSAIRLPPFSPRAVPPRQDV